MSVPHSGSNRTGVGTLPGDIQDAASRLRAVDSSVPHAAAVMQVDGYASLGLSEKRDIRNSIGLFVTRWCSSILEQAWFTPAEMEKFEASVRRRVHQGISLVAILCAFRLGT